MAGLGKCKKLPESQSIECSSWDRRTRTTRTATTAATADPPLPPSSPPPPPPPLPSLLLLPRTPPPPSCTPDPHVPPRGPHKPSPARGRQSPLRWQATAVPSHASGRKRPPRRRSRRQHAAGSGNSVRVQDPNPTQLDSGAGEFRSRFGPAISSPTRTSRVAGRSVRSDPSPAIHFCIQVRLLFTEMPFVSKSKDIV